MYTNYVYKRRRFQNSIALSSTSREEKVSYLLDCCNSGTDLKFHHLPHPEDRPNSHGQSLDAFVNKHKSNEFDVHVGGSDLNCTSELEAIVTSNKRDEKHVSELHKNNHPNVSLYHFSVNDSCSTSKSHSAQNLSLRNVEVEDMGECSSVDVTVLEQCSLADVPVLELPSDFISSRDFCLHILKTNSPGVPSSEAASGSHFSSNVLGGISANILLLCRTCGFMGNSKGMLICDLCDGAFHLHCCLEKTPFREEWYCRPCSRKNPRPLLDATLGKSFTNVSEEYKRRILHKELGPIQFMLNDMDPYTSGVRIGNDYQADIPELPSPTTKDDDKYHEPSLLNPAECSNLNGPSISGLARLNSIGNWVQCREVVYTNSNKHSSGVICGKWRRAPLFVIQSDDWDCSCAVVWDPIHADCAVPQELETKEVLKQLKFIEMVRTQLDKKQRCNRPKR